MLFQNSPEITPGAHVEAIKSIEDFKQTEMSKIVHGIVHGIVFNLDQEMKTLDSFHFGDNEYKVDTVAAAVKAIGQVPSQMSLDIYNQIIKKK